MIKKVLVANRAEIALRVMRTLREMRIGSVAVYSEIDRNARHVRYADESVAIGPAESRKSYLDMERVIGAAKSVGADAIHPGYGFLSENAEFAEACERNGIRFIGPSAAVIRSMGSKVMAREAMTKAGVPVVPGVKLGPNMLSSDALIKAAEGVGYPLLIKASAGGGGKGMRRVERPQDLAAQVERARAESQSAFADPEVYLEREIRGGRHVEVQILGDAHGHCVHLFERDCSLQRRHQKVVEETSSPAREIHPAAIDKLCEMGRQAALAVGYASAGTVECLLSPNGDYYFLEMNTRLQVEHPVTELVTGIDIVREQILVANDQPLRFTQNDVVRRGHAVEARIYAEDTSNHFAPSPGKLHVCTFADGPFVRCDAGVGEGDEISSYYDPMIAKLSVWGPDRPSAVQRMSRALSECRMLGPKTNLGFLRRLLSDERVVAGQYSVDFIESNVDTLCGEKKGDTDGDAVLVAAAAMAAYAYTQQTVPKSTGPSMSGSQVSRWRSSNL